jgi:hypothetical protein
LTRQSATADGLSTAWPGTILKHVPYTDANKLHNLLLTIKANIGFDRLSEMRANSPTGGALGQVSELENLLLQATQGSLDQNQSPEELKKTLDMIRVNLAQLRAETELAFKGDYAEVLTQPNIHATDRNRRGAWNAAERVPKCKVERITAGMVYQKQRKILQSQGKIRWVTPWKKLTLTPLQSPRSASLVTLGRSG